MKILIIAGFADSLLNFRGALISALQSKAYQVHVAAPNLERRSDLILHLQSLGIVAHNIPLQRTGMNPLADAWLLIQLWRLMNRLRPDCVLAYTIKPVIYGSIAARLARVPRRFALITGLGYAFQGEGQRRLLRSLVQHLYGLALRCTHKVFFQNPDDKSLFLTSGILNAAKPSIVLNGSGVDLFQYDVAALPDRTSFLLIARLLGDKGVREYAEAACILRQEGVNAEFAMVGWIDENPDAIRQDELDAWVREGTIKFLGKLADVRPAIAGSTVYVLPSYREGTPRSVLEAMAMGRAVITTDAPGCRETVVDGYNGFLVPVKSVEDLVRAMRRFIVDPTLATAMGLHSRQIAIQKYNVDDVNAKMLEEMGIFQCSVQ